MLSGMGRGAAGLLPLLRESVVSTHPPTPGGFIGNHGDTP